MNLLIVGNGFDIAHGLPTKYMDFLYFVKALKAGMKDAQENRFRGLDDYKRLNCSVVKFLNDILQYRSSFIKECKDENVQHNNRKFMQFSDLNLTYVDTCADDCNFQTYTSDNKKQQIGFAFIYNIYRLLIDNYWIERFKEIEKYNNWVDFESEIAKTCIVLERVLDLPKHGVDDRASVLIENDLYIAFEDYFMNANYSLGFSLNNNDYTDLSRNEIIDNKIIQRYNKYSFKVSGLYKIRNGLIDALERLIFAFELYLMFIVEDIALSNTKKQSIFQDLHIDKVLSFNYTHTWQRTYGEVDIQYLHGSIRNSQEYLDIHSPLVLGMNESLTDSEIGQNTNLIKFKKYYQRIRKNTDGAYKKWVEYLEFENTIKKENLGTCYDSYCEAKHDYQDSLTVKIIEEASQKEGVEFQNRVAEFFESYYEKDTVGRNNSSCIYIYGHSLDVTDKDVLRSFIDYDNIKIVIYYLDENDLDTKIENLVKIIGHDKLIQRRGSARQTIFFRNIATGQDI